MCSYHRPMWLVVIPEKCIMDSVEYLIAWACYLLGAALLYALFCNVTRWVRWFELRNLLRLPLAAMLFVPVYADPAQPFLAPALIVALFDLANHDPGLGVRGVKLILFVMGALLVLLLIESTARRLLARR